MSERVDVEKEGRVRGYLGLVYGAAVRQMRGDGSGAEDVTQAVMMVMLRKEREGRLPEERFMTGWLMKVTGYAVREWRVRAGRRARYEGGAAREKGGSQEPEASSQEVRCLLDEALLALSGVDREVVVRRYLRGESLAEVGKVVGMNENTVGRRIARAVEKLRKVMGRRGVVVPAGVVVGVMVAEMGVKVPAAVASSLGAGSVMTGLAKAVFWRMAMAKVFAGVAASVVVVAAVSGVVVMGMKGKVAAAEVAGTQMGGVAIVVSRETTGIVSPLKADGTVDYVEALNLKYGAGVTAENNGFVVWLENNRYLQDETRGVVFEKAGAKKTGTAMTWSYFQYLVSAAKSSGRAMRNNGSVELRRAVLRMWRAEEYPELTDYLKTIDKDKEAVVDEVIGREKWWVPLVGKDMQEAEDWAGVDEEIARVFCARGLLRAKGGDFVGFLADMRRAMKLDQRMENTAEPSERRRRAAEDQMIYQALGAVVGTGTLTNEQLKQVRLLMDEMMPLEPWWKLMDEWLRWNKLELAQKFARGGKVSMEGGLYTMKDGKPVDAAVVDPLVSVDVGEVDWNMALRRINERVDAEVAMAKAVEYRERRIKGMETLGTQRDNLIAVMKSRGDEETWLKKDAGETREAYSKRVGDGFFLAFSWEVMPVLWEGRTERAELQREMLGVLLKLAEYKARTGNWPEKVEDAGVKLPVDMFGADVTASVKYVHGEVGARVYSVGPNGQDDGGLDDGGYVGTTVDDFGVGVVEGQ